MFRRKPQPEVHGLYRVRLHAQGDQQFRLFTVEADSESIARQMAESKEQELVAFQLPVDEFAAHDPLMSKDATGKVQGPLRIHAKARWHAHHQERPYLVHSVEPALPNVAQLVGAVRLLQQDEKAWKRTLDALRDAGVPINAVTGTLFGLTAQTMIDGSAAIAWASATIKVALTTSTYTPNQDTHHFFSDVTNEVTGTGYTAGGATLGSKTSTYDSATDQIRLDAADTSWTTSTITARRAVIWNDTAGASTTDPVMGWLDFGADVSTTAGTFQITWDTTGIIVYDVT